MVLRIVLKVFALLGVLTIITVVVPGAWAYFRYQGAIYAQPEQVLPAPASTSSKLADNPAAWQRSPGAGGGTIGSPSGFRSQKNLIMLVAPIPANPRTPLSLARRATVLVYGRSVFVGRTNVR